MGIGLLARILKAIVDRTTRIDIKPLPDPESLFWRGVALHRQGAFEPALACFERAVLAQADFLPALRRGALVLAKLGQWSEATDWAKRVLALSPESLRSLHFLAKAARLAGRVLESEEALRRWLDRRPQDVRAWVELGWTLRAMDRYPEAEYSFRKAIELAPDMPAPRYGLVTVLRESGSRDQASAELERLLLQHPNNPSVHLVAGAEHKENGNCEAARQSYLRAVQLAPRRTEPWTNLEPVLFRLGCYEEALEAGRRGVALDPRSPNAHLNLAIAALAQGRFQEGWRHYQWRFRILMKRDYPVPPIPGNPLVRRPEDFLPFDFAGRRVTLVEDQGLGDELSFLRFAPLLRARGAHVVYVPDPRLAGMVARAGIVDRVTAIGEDAPADTEVFLACGDLPLVLGMKTAEELPPPVPLAPLPEKCEAVRDRLKECGLLGRPLVGVTWRGGTKQPRGGALFKEAPIERLAETLRSLPVEVIVLQRKPAERELALFGEHLGRAVHDFTDLNDDLEAMLALVGELDDYVAVSNTNVHLRAGTGGPARILMPHPPDYRWMVEGERSPWFPDFKVYRQTVAGSWDAALAELRSDLEKAFQTTPG